VRLLASDDQRERAGPPARFSSLSLDRDAGVLLQPYPADEMEHWPVSQRVNGSALDDAGMLNPL
jgi:hypothetical protein